MNYIKRMTTLIKQLLNRLFPKKRKCAPAALIPRAAHSISRKNINNNALKVLYRLHEHGYSAYLVGGCLRDLLLHKKPKDFDIATNARPETVKKIFRNALLIGRRFRIAHIRFGREIIEVTTFRAHSEKKSFKHRMVAAHGMLLRDNVYGTIEEDVWRRDFTMNAVYYNIADFSLVDYCGGLADIEAKIVRMIGDPVARYQEDPVRLLRAIRFAAKLNFTIDPATAEPIPRLASLLQHVPAARLFEEVLKLFHHGQALKTYQLLRDYRLFEQLFPQTAHCLDQETAADLLEMACQNTDQRVKAGKTVSPSFLFAVFLWPAVQNKVRQSLTRHTPLVIAYQQAISHVLAAQQKKIMLPRRYSSGVREIWELQNRLIQRRSFMIPQLMQHPRFRAAYDFILLRAQIQEIPAEIGEWWTQFLLLDETQQKKWLESIAEPQRKKHYFRKKGKS